MNKPNIIFYFSDQQRWDTCGCYGQELNVTPNIDKLAEEGTLFSNAFSCQPVCGPMRSCLQSGVYATKTGCYKNGIALPENYRTIASHLKESGYNTSYFGKWHLASDKEHHLAVKAVPKERRGDYDYWRAADVLEFTSHGYDGYVFDENCQKLKFKGYRADKINDFAIEYLDNYNSEKPFFMFISQLEPHHQNDHLRFEAPKGLKKEFKNYKIPGDLKGTCGDWKIQMPSYLACCNRIDTNVGKLIDKLKAAGIYENTIIIYTSDHGCHFRTRNAEYKRSCHEASIHIPLVISGGPFTGKGKFNELVSLIDLPATILSLAGAQIPEQYDGTSLTEFKGHDSIYVQISESQTGRAVRTNRWKYSVTNKKTDIPYADEYTEDFLYDLDNDINEKNNLISLPEYKEVKRQMRLLLLDHIKNAGEPTPRIIEK